MMQVEPDADTVEVMMISVIVPLVTVAEAIAPPPPPERATVTGAV
jgi:hypothetical protein